MRACGVSFRCLVAAVEGKGLNQEYTFELFVCMAILRMYRDDLLKTGDVADIFTVINGCVHTLCELFCTPQCHCSAVALASCFYVFGIVACAAIALNLPVTTAYSMVGTCGTLAACAGLWAK